MIPRLERTISCSIFSEKTYYIECLFTRIRLNSRKSIYLWHVTKILLLQQLITWYMQINNHHKKERERVHCDNNTKHNNVTHAYIYNI